MKIVLGIVKRIHNVLPRHNALTFPYKRQRTETTESLRYHHDNQRDTTTHTLPVGQTDGDQLKQDARSKFVALKPYIEFKFPRYKYKK